MPLGIELAGRARRSSTTAPRPGPMSSSGTCTTTASGSAVCRRWAERRSWALIQRSACPGWARRMFPALPRPGSGWWIPPLQSPMPLPRTCCRRPPPPSNVSAPRARPCCCAVYGPASRTQAVAALYEAGVAGVTPLEALEHMRRRCSTRIRIRRSGRCWLEMPVGTTEPTSVMPHSAFVAVKKRYQAARHWRLFRLRSQSRTLCVHFLQLPSPRQSSSLPRLLHRHRRARPCREQ